MIHPYNKTTYKGKIWYLYWNRKKKKYSKIYYLLKIPLNSGWANSVASVQTNNNAINQTLVGVFSSESYQTSANSIRDDVNCVRQVLVNEW